MSARQLHTESSRATPVRSGSRHGDSSFDRIHQALDGYFAKAVEARKRLLDGPYDAKLIHAWRVNLRRITATLKDVARWSDDDLHDVHAYLRTAREATGQSRDIDILLEETLRGFLEKKDHDAVAEKLPAKLVDQQQQAHQQAVIALKKHSLTVPLRAWRHWAASVEPPSDSMMKKLAAGAIERRYGVLLKRAAKLDGGQKRLHRLRTATKKLRYSIELYQHAFPKQATTAWLKQLADLQTHLGLAHDRMMGRELIASLAPDDRQAIKPVRRWARQTAYDASKDATQSLAALDRLKPYWRSRAH
ncbi:MAG TPA: CHAD domain-containing protein [Dyella sp.]|uniref:CHAD domain-containing protein n=1 Tax=Dyella sp. TaxID=1869338 RepID=UPI002D7708CC|nr:CHAD domain-containing protein [Dyella sp.]HET6554743.1 CHAD domain-containing protein [Dyella sp.]